MVDKGCGGAYRCVPTLFAALGATGDACKVLLGGTFHGRHGVALLTS